MFKNETTYDSVWNTEENRSALRKLESKYLDNCECSSHCPVAWAPEVLELLETIDRELGIRKNQDTINGFYVQGNIISWFFISPWKNLFQAFSYQLFGSYRYNKTHKKIMYVIRSFISPIKYGLSALRVKMINPCLNKLGNKRVSLSQIKEKFGYFTFYYDAPDAFKDFIERERRKCEIKLAIKGAYLPIESFWDASVVYAIETEHHPDCLSIESDPNTGLKRVTETKYRIAMKELGLNLKDIKDKADIKAATKADPV